MIHEVSTEFAGRPIKIQTGRLARQADASVVVTYGDTVVLASATDNKNSRTTSSTLLAQKVIEQINAQNANVGTPITMTDCAGNQWNVLGAGGAAPIGAGATLSTNAASPYYGGVDPTQGFGTVPNGYGMQYVDCAVNGRQGVYDVRWNVITLGQYARMITVTAGILRDGERVRVATAPAPQQGVRS